MKTIKFIGMALFAILMCVNFTSCNQDDDPTKNDNGIITKEKKLTKIEINEFIWVMNPFTGKWGSNTHKEIITFKYEQQGKLLEATLVGSGCNGSYNYSYQFTWTNDAILIKEINIEDNNSISNYTLSLENGLVKCDDSYDNYVYNYNSLNRLIKYSSDEWNEPEITSITWDGDKLCSIYKENYVGYYDYVKSNFYYEKTCQKGYSPLLAMEVDGVCNLLFIAHPEIIGIRTSQIPTEHTYTTARQHTNTTEDNYSSIISYEFDNDGYISKIIEKDENKKDFTYTLIWE